MHYAKFYVRESIYDMYLFLQCTVHVDDKGNQKSFTSPLERAIFSA